MFKCSYLVYVNDNELTIPKVFDSLSKIQGNFLKEFIIVNDGSKDNSLKMIGDYADKLSKVTIITHKLSGPSISINKALRIAQGDYVHFVRASMVIDPHSTLKLVSGCTDNNLRVAILDDNTSKKKSFARVIRPSLKSVFNKSVPKARSISQSETLVHLSLLDYIGGADEDIYTSEMSLSLKCAKHSNFYYLARPSAAIIKDENKVDHKFEDYNNLKAIYNFIIKDPGIIKEYSSELLKISMEFHKGIRNKSSVFIKYLSSKLLGIANDQKIINLYKDKIDRLF